MLDTSTHEFKQKVFKYFRESIYDQEVETNNEAAQIIWGRFDSEYNYEFNRKRYPNLQRRIAEWLAGLPLNIAFSYCDIREITEEWHECALTEKQADMVQDRWFSFMAFKLMQMWEAYDVDYRRVS